jgi:hypothetical protein
MTTNLRDKCDKLFIFLRLSGMKYPIQILAPTFSTVSLAIVPHRSHCGLYQKETESQNDRIIRESQFQFLRRKLDIVTPLTYLPILLR